nr:MAG TPA: hypothetical protein [Caudoviricetes sp.]
MLSFCLLCFMYMFISWLHFLFVLHRIYKRLNIKDS